MIAIIDYDIGNLGAVANMLHRLGVPCVITSNPEQIEQADRIILPGNGAFDACMQNLNNTGLIPLLDQKVLVEKVPCLGICVGAQMLGNSSEEGDVPGLGWVNMQVKRFPSLSGLRVPHMDWCHVNPCETSNVLVQGIREETRFYFVHSYYMEPANPNEVLMTAYYGIKFAAAVCVRNIAGVQFHPEKSHRSGKQLLERFAKDFR